MNVRLLVWPILAATFVASGCGTTSGGAGGGVAPGEQPADPAVDSSLPSAIDPEFGQTLRRLDTRADEYLRLAAEPGEDARSRQDVLVAALATEVTRNSSALLSLLDGGGGPDDVSRRRIAAKALAFAAPSKDVVRALSSALGGSDAHVATSSAWALSRIASSDTPLAPLVAAAQSADRDVRNNSLLALWHVLDARTDVGAAAPDAASKSAILSAAELALFDPEDPITRGHAAAALGALGDPRAVDPLLNLLRDSNSFVRTQTALALGKLGERRAIAPLVDVIDESARGTVRSAVILAISVLVERQGGTVPASIVDDERAWRAFVERSVGFSIDPPLTR